MVRKSERNKSKGTPDKSPEKSSRKVGRQSRRRKKSSSGSEPESDIPAGDIKPEQESSSETDKQKTDSASPKGETKDSEATSSAANRSKRRKQTAEGESCAKPQSTDREWKEDETFWAGGESVVETSEAKPKEDEGALWKVQSANGSSGEIQKLKICRQKPESSPSHVKDMSPGRKRSSRSSNSETGKDSPRTSECEASGSTVTEAETPSSTVPDQSEPVPADSTETPVAQESGTKMTQQEVVEPPLPEPSVRTEKQDLPTQSDEQTEKPAGRDEQAAGEGDKMEETPNSTEDLPDESVQATVSRSSPDKEAPDSSTRRKQGDEGSDSSESSSNSDSSSAGDRRSRKRSRKSRRSSRSGEGGQEEGETQRLEPSQPPPSTESTPQVQELPTGDKKSEGEAVEKPEEKSPAPSEKRESAGEEKLVDEKKETVMEIEKPPQSDQQPKKEESKSEKIVERRRTSGESEKVEKESDEKIREENNREKSPAVEKPEKEEGELSPTRDSPVVKERIEKTTPGRTKIIINKPQNENVSKPTILKRVPVEAPPAQRKRRAMSKTKPKEASIAISSTSLKLIVPEAKPLPLEEVDLSIEEEKEEEPKPKRMVNLSKSRDIEIRVKNDVREVTKKEPIIIEKKVVKEEKLKETPAQLPAENHKGSFTVVRKISIVSDDAKKLTRSPSPSSRKATAVLFITNLVRPFTAPQLRELLARTGTIAPNGFYIDKIKSKCYVKYTEVDMAVETRHALHGVRWPVNNPKTLKVEFASPEDMALVQELAEDETKKPESVDSGWLNEQAALKPARRVTAGVREWDVGKIPGNDGAPPQPKEESVDVRKKLGEGDWPRNKERGPPPAGPQEIADGRRRERPHSPDHKEYPARKVKRRDNDAPSKLLDDLFRKTRATPCIYWLPLTAAQIVVKEEMRRQHMAEHERRLAEMRKSEQSRRERERERRKK